MRFKAVRRKAGDPSRVTIESVKQFLSKLCEHDPGKSISLSELADAYRLWEGKPPFPLKPMVLAKCVLKVAKVSKRRVIYGGVTEWRYHGIGFKEQ